ncbi:hypothetical protein B0H14DRAFT_3858395 [Mycena olivaceomarginata]|nr:hypothetical protein B0H14DRAFT_3858395 [Mycena olivaceomarginata]
MSAASADLLHRMDKLDSIRSYAGFLAAALQEASVNWEAMNEVDQLTACRAYLMLLIKGIDVETANAELFGDIGGMIKDSDSEPEKSFEKRVNRTVINILADSNVDIRKIQLELAEAQVVFRRLGSYKYRNADFDESDINFLNTFQSELARKAEAASEFISNLNDPILRQAYLSVLNMPGIDVNTANTIVTEYIDYTPKVSDFAEAAAALRKEAAPHPNPTCIRKEFQRFNLDGLDW